MEDPVPDLSREVGGGTFRPCQDHQARHHPVQTVDGADVLLPQGSPAEVRDAAGLVGGQDPGRLDDHHEGRVRMDDLENGHGKYLVSQLCIVYHRQR